MRLTSNLGFEIRPSAPVKASWRRLPWLGLLCFALASGTRAAEPFTPAGSPRPDFWDTDGTINAIAATNGVVYVGGSFSYVAPKGTKVAGIDAYTGERLAEFPAIKGARIHAIVEDGNGGWFIGGEFTHAGGLPRTNLVHVLSDHRIDPNFLPNPNAAVHALAVDGNTLFVGGDFTSIDGRARSRIAALHTATGSVSAWTPEADDRVSVLLVDGGRLFAGGYFNGIGNQPRTRLAELDIASGTPTAWSPQCDGAVLALGLRHGRLYVGGFFNRIGEQLRNGLACLDTTTSLATSWDPDPVGGKVSALRVVCDTVFVGGSFTHMGAAPRHRVAAIHADGSGVPTDWDPNLGLTLPCRGASSVSGLEVSGYTVYLAGEFASVGNEIRRDLAAVDLGTARVLPWNPDLNGGATAIAVSGRAVVAGFAATPGGLERCNLAAFDAVTGRVADWNPGADWTVNALVAAGDRIYVGGGFTNAGGLPRSRIAALDAMSGTAISNWINQADGSVLALAVSGGTLFAGGRFTLMGGTTRQRLAALNLTTGALLNNWPQVQLGEVDVLAVSDGVLYAGGSFRRVGAFNRNQLAALDAASGAVLDWDPGANWPVRALVVGGGVLYAGGDSFLAAVDLPPGQTTEWNLSADYSVNALAISGNTLYAGGNFLDLGGEPRLGLAAVNADGQLLDWNPGASIWNQVFALAISGNALHVAGASGLIFDGAADFHTMGVFPRVGAPVITQSPRDQRVPLGQNVEFSLLASGPAPLFYQWQFNGTNLPDETNATLRLAGVQVPQSGRYQIIVTNSTGAATAEATLTVLEAPDIVVQPIAQTAPPGATVTLSVMAVGNPSPLYQWRLNGADIAGAVFSTLTLSNVSPASGGSYQVVVFNGVGAMSSDAATVDVTGGLALPFADQFTLAGPIPGGSGIGSGHNVAATNETMEPRHAGKVGGSSVWLKWVAPDHGVATFDTRGSSFDTLLAVYTGTDVVELEPVAADDDRGGFLTSRASFNAVAGTEYRIAVDGSIGATGRVVLAWELDTNTTPFPRFITQPISQAVPPGTNAAFFVEVNSPTPVSYQWFKGCDLIPGATNAVLVILNVGRRDLGAYRVVVMNASSHAAESFEALLQIGPQREVVARDKLGDLLAFTASGAGTPLLLSFGVPFGSQMLNNTGATNSPGEPNHCNVVGGASILEHVLPAADGILLIDTMGSSIDTVLAVYRGGGSLTGLYSAREACDDNGAPDGLRSLVRFPVRGGVTYLVVVDGVNRAQGFVSLNWQYGLAPAILPATALPPVPLGQDLLLRVTITNSFNAAYQWLWNGQSIPHATNATLMVSNFSLANAGSYSTIISNFAGVVTNVQTVNVQQLYLRAELNSIGQKYRLWLPLVTNQVVLETSSNLQPSSWVPLYRHPALEPGGFLDVSTTNGRYNFFRVRPGP